MLGVSLAPKWLARKATPQPVHKAPCSPSTCVSLTSETTDPRGLEEQARVNTQKAKHSSCFVSPPEYSRACALGELGACTYLPDICFGQRPEGTWEVGEPQKPIPARAPCPHKLLVWFL